MKEIQKNSRTDEIIIGNKKRIARHTDGFFLYLVSLSKWRFSDTPCRAIQATEDFRRLVEVAFCKLKNYTKNIVH